MDTNILHIFPLHSKICTDKSHLFRKKQTNIKLDKPLNQNKGEVQRPMTWPKQNNTITSRSDILAGRKEHYYFVAH